MPAAASSQRSPKSGPWTTIGCAVLTLCLLIILVFPLLTQDGHGRRTQCISNVKQLGTSFQIYADSNDDRLPPMNWADAIYPFTKNWGLYTCDKVREQNGKWGYAMNFEKLGMAVSKFDKPEEQVLLFETDALAKNVVANINALAAPRHGERVVVGFLDTSTRLRSPEEIRAKYEYRLSPQKAGVDT